jgi:hypothetical protein
MDKPIVFQCATCGETHEGPPSLFMAAPRYYYELSEDEKITSAELTSDTCTIRNEYFFVRGIFEFDVHGLDRTFSYGAWASLTKKNFQRYIELFEATDVSGEGPYFGWFSNSIAGYPETLELKVDVCLLPYPARPVLRFHQCDHPLISDLKYGIAMARLCEILALNWHAS